MKIKKNQWLIVLTFWLIVLLACGRAKETPQTAEGAVEIGGSAATEEPAEAEAPAATEEPAEAEAEAPAATEEPAEAEAPAATEEPAEAEAPAATEEPAEAEAPAASPEDATSVILESAVNLKELESYRAKATTEMGGQTIKALYEYDLPDNVHMVMDVAGQTTEMIIIGDDTYLKAGDSWTKMPDTGAGSDSMGATVAQFDLSQENVLDARLEGTEDVAGVPCQKYVYTASIPDSPPMEITTWIGLEDGLPYKIVSQSGADMIVTQELYDFNAGITIEAPLE